MTDILSDNTGDLLFVNGDILYGISDRQHQRDILMARPGDYKMALPMGVGIQDFIKDDDATALLGEIKQQFDKDGLVIKEMTYSNSQLKINAVYGSDNSGG